MTIPSLDIAAVGPILFVSVGSMLVLLGEVLLSRVDSIMGHRVTPSLVGVMLAVTAMVFLGLATLMALQQPGTPATPFFNADNPMFQVDRFSATFIAALGLASMLCCALAIGYLDAMRINHGEYYALLLFATAGMMLMVGAVDLLAVFLGLELMSIPIYVLAGFDRTRLRSNESAMKYFLIGAFASALLLYGMALLYGVSGSTSFEDIRAAFDPGNPLTLAGVGLVVVGFGFKISSVPFHQWTPDVYEGAPASVTAFMSVTVKLAAFAALIRFLLLAIDPLGEVLGNVFWVMALLTLVVGNVMALIQDNVKRLLAYSSIAHAGYLLIGLVPGSAQGYSAVVFYLFCYAFMNLGAFTVLVALTQRGQECERVDSFAGLARSRPGLAALMTLFMLSLAGIPGTAGFIAKWMVFSAAVEAGQLPLAIVGVLMSVVSVYYYLRIPVLMYMREPGDEAPPQELATGEFVVLAVCASAILYLGILPNSADFPLLDLARESIQQLFAA